MQKTRLTQNNIENILHQPELWLQEIQQKKTLSNSHQIKQAIDFSKYLCSHHSHAQELHCLKDALAMAELLVELHQDDDTIIGGILYRLSLEDEIAENDIAENFSNQISKLVGGAKRLDAFQFVPNQKLSKTSLDNLRKLLLSIASDLRIVMIKLSERLIRLRYPAYTRDEDRIRDAEGVMDIYAPLANRLGLGHLKWQLEDLAFRHLQPEKYKEISKLLRTRRDEREHYVENFKQTLAEKIQSLHLEKFEISGRAKHIYSIYKKMSRKNVLIEEIYDSIAFRVLVPSIEDCYHVLSCINSLWEPIPKEFDDYIAQPKSNGYRSIHTAVYGPDQKQIEIQIRTFTMHEENEFGGAAHWIYKEGNAQNPDYQNKIARLRQVFAWQEDLHHPVQEIFEENIYVFTPNGDIIDLPNGATPLDFAYYLHTDIGNRTRGAKVNQRIVPLTYLLKTGDTVDVLTAKEPHPSRDWLNPAHGYLNTARARAKVHSWFRKQDVAKHFAEGEALVERELKKAHSSISPDFLATEMRFQHISDLYVSLGRGDTHIQTLQNTIKSIEEKSLREKAPHAITLGTQTLPAKAEKDIAIEGVGDLMTHVALCCKPIPGDLICGYVTQGQGVSIHRQDCSNLVHLSSKHPEKVLIVTWGKQPSQKYAVDISVDAYDRAGLIRDITQILAAENISVANFHCYTQQSNSTAHITLTLSVDHLGRLNQLLIALKQIPDVYEVKRFH